ncbi:uncharacterized protein V1510DRAFT_420522 [Dipodascopsis tothii]|uniref:uncharacterized protein n=1 Tax=Dipodascopsis tothii TaxID=44089 RepID=UPI0034CEA167
MILYSLALRHGWGIRANPTEAIQWLKRAAEMAMAGDAIQCDSSGTPYLSDEQTMGKQLRSQMGLAMYELGMSYANSWGVEKDEPRALNCFEFGGLLGDGDALYEAATLYMRSGPGRKKDLYKAAALFRAAADKGVSVVGESWIYKEKYTSNPVNPKAAKARQASDKDKDTRKRSFFGAKK